MPFLHSHRKSEALVLMVLFLIRTCLIMNICKECYTTSHKQVLANSRNSTRFILLGQPHLSPCPLTCSHSKASAHFLCSSRSPVNNRSKFQSKQREGHMLKLTGQLEANRMQPRIHPPINNHLQEGSLRTYTLPKIIKQAPLLIIIMNSSRNTCSNNSSYLSKSNKNFSKRCILRLCMG